VAGRAELPDSDDELLAACLRGDQAAWDTLVDRYAALIYSIPLKYGFHEADAADVFQSVCVTLLEKLGTIREPRGLAAWIMTTTSRQCLALVRRQTRDRNRSADGMVVGEYEAADPDQLPEDEILALERQYLVRTAVSQLPPNCRVLIEALFAAALESESESESEKTSYQQLADRLGVPLNSIGPTRARCLNRLRRLLTAAGYAP
jgi:RNA polymerase sigma factor (sigma-70 family)